MKYFVPQLAASACLTVLICALRKTDACVSVLDFFLTLMNSGNFSFTDLTNIQQLLRWPTAARISE